MNSPKTHWVRIVVGGFLAELALILAIVPLGLRLGDRFLHYAAPPGSLVTCFFGGLWVGRGIRSRQVDAAAHRAGAGSAGNRCGGSSDICRGWKQEVCGGQDSRRLYRGASR